MQVKTKNLIVGVLAVLLVGLLWYRVVYSPMESKASKAKTEAHDADVTAANLRQALSGTTSSNKKAKAHEIPSTTMLAAIPADAAEASFLRSLDELRTLSGADWQSVTPTAPSVVGTVTTINVAITVQGTEDQIDRYVNGLAALRRLFVLDNLSITQAGASAAAGAAGAGAAGHPGSVFLGDQFQAAISGRIFSQASAVAATTPAGTGTAGTGSRAASTTPATGAPAPTGGATSPGGIQNN